MTPDQRVALEFAFASVAMIGIFGIVEPRHGFVALVAVAVIAIVTIWRFA